MCAAVRHVSALHGRHPVPRRQGPMVHRAAAAAGLPRSVPTTVFTLPNPNNVQRPFLSRGPRRHMRSTTFCAPLISLRTFLHIAIP